MVDAARSLGRWMGGGKEAVGSGMRRRRGEEAVQDTIRVSTSLYSAYNGRSPVAF